MCSAKSRYDYTLIYLSAAINLQYQFCKPYCLYAWSRLQHSPHGVDTLVSDLYANLFPIYEILFSAETTKMSSDLRVEAKSLRGFTISQGNHSRVVPWHIIQHRCDLCIGHSKLRPVSFLTIFLASFSDNSQKIGKIIMQLIYKAEWISEPSCWVKSCYYGTKPRPQSCQAYMLHPGSTYCRHLG